LPGGLVRLELTRGYATLIDVADLERALHYRWYASRHGLRQYAYANTWVNGRRGHLALHRWLFVHDAVNTDHRNGDTLDNRRSNLRPATVRQNRQGYRILPAGKTSRYRGVCWDKARQRWHAHIKEHRRVVAQARFATEEEAARWYDEQARARFGEFATLNFPVVQ